MHTHTHTCNIYNTPITDYSILYSCYISTDIMYSVYIYYIYNIYIYMPVYIIYTVYYVCVRVCIVSYYIIASVSARHGMAYGWRGPSTARNNALRVWDNTMQ